jgi:hypothetical protein
MFPEIDDQTLRHRRLQREGHEIDLLTSHQYCIDSTNEGRDCRVSESKQLSLYQLLTNTMPLYSLGLPLVRL